MSTSPTRITSLQLEFVEKNTIIGELAVFVPPADQSVTTPTNWTIAKAPVAASFYQNGIRQAAGSDYTLTGNTVTSPSWAPTDRILCDYQY